MSFLNGTWFNELGSRMDLFADANGFLAGQYFSNVGNVSIFYELAGRYDISSPADKGATLGWAVTYRTATVHSTATWSGQFFNDTGTPVILTQWLLSRSSPLDDLWNSVTVGHDEFGRTPVSEEAKAEARLRARGSKFPAGLNELD
ncbi:tamavidin1 [Pterulicium gracile]|uniref:Tamavidin1 n=1 Tax=Pterulicium gracile TaxID=1884261 RepID=A0A5C3Q8T0_9AGAR|nr:tamavidin1 [Pterula gracilis]